MPDDSIKQNDPPHLPLLKLATIDPSFVALVLTFCRAALAVIDAHDEAEADRVSDRARSSLNARLYDVKTLSLHEVAESLGIGYDTVRDRACMGDLPGAFQVGRWWRVRYWEFKKWFDLGCPE